MTNRIETRIEYIISQMIFVLDIKHYFHENNLRNVWEII